MADVTFTVDGKKLTAPAGTLLIEACRKAGIEIPAFCYYPGLSLQAACRMCVVRQEKVPKLQTACTTTVAEGQVFTTESPEIAQARKATIELLLGNHPLDCPVCDAGGECELQDMTFKYGAGESLYVDAKRHREEQQWSPAVFYDRPRCILCYRCTRVCGEGMDVWALGVQNRGVSSVITAQRRRPARLRAVRHVHRHLPRRRTHQRQLSLQDPPMGDEPRLHRLHPLLAIEAVPLVGHDHGTDPAILHAESPDIHAFAAHPSAAVAKDATGTIVEDCRGPLLFFAVVLCLGVEAFAGAVLEGHVLQFALAAGVAYRAVERVVAEKESMVALRA